MIIDTPIGEIRVLTDENRVSEIILPGWKSTVEPLKPIASNSFEKGLKRSFDKYFNATNPKVASKSWLDLLEYVLPTRKIIGVSDFYQRIYYELATNVLSSMTISYKELAELSGSPRGSRAVGSAMRKNPLAIIVPCHRVITSSGDLGGYMGASLEDSLKVKRWLLEHEGVYDFS